MTNEELLKLYFESMEVIADIFLKYCDHSEAIVEEYLKYWN